ncbi:MAG: hypothetical protein JWO82_476 [Akkermansiaceae bacterium]|nr:hypothetical protein [Akkermansiaceae bacterium]
MVRSSLLSLALLSAATLLTGCSVNKTFKDKTNERLERAEKKQGSSIEAPKPIDDKVAKIWEADPRYRNAVGHRGGKMPRLISSPSLFYPIDPRIADQTAAVIVTFVVNEAGMVEEAKVVMTSNKRFDSGSLASAREMKFSSTGNGSAKYFFTVPMIYIGEGAQVTRTNPGQAKPEEVTASAPKLPKPGPAGAAVTVLFTVEEDGRVSATKVEKSNDARFNEAALESVRGRKFPARPKGSGSHQARLKISFQ